MAVWLEPEDIDETPNYRDLYYEASRERRELRKAVRASEHAHGIQKDRAFRYQARMREQEREMEEMRRELVLHRHIRQLEAENERLRRRPREKGPATS